MEADHVFSRVRKMQREKRLKEVVVNVYDYFEEVSRHQQSQGPLKRTSDATGVHVPTSRGYRERTLTLVELLFQLQQRDTNSLDTC